MPDLQWNHIVWNDRWASHGDEWSETWGGARSQWYGAIYPRIADFLPAHSVLEIAPGRGRWTQFLLRHCDEYVGIDLAANCIAACKLRFAAASRARFFVNDGTSLGMVPDSSVDFVFSFDSLVHAEIDVVSEYVRQVLDKLTPTGAAFLHHSNADDSSADRNESQGMSRAQSVSALAVKDVVEDYGGRVLVQEEVNWGGATRIDCFTTLCRLEGFPGVAPRLLRNDGFMAEAKAIREYQSAYRVC